MEFNQYQMMSVIAKNALARQEERPGDFMKDGILYCGTCKEPRRKWDMFNSPLPDDPGHMEPLLRTCQCLCERRRDEEEERLKKARIDAKRFRQLSDEGLMDEKFLGATFQNFKRTQDNEKAYRTCKRYAERFGAMVENNQGLLFWGGVGTGKTFAAACIANSLMARGIPVAMTSFVKLLDSIQSREKTERGIIERLNRAKLVIFDDLGAERNTAWGLEVVYNIVDSRYRKRLPSIFTTNLNIGAMKDEQDIRYGRIYDRIFENCYPVRFAGTSWRRKEAGRRFEEMGKLLGLDEEV